MPITFSDEELALLQALAAPINQRHRHQFLTEVTAGLEAAARETGVAPGPGGVHRVGRVVQRRFWNSAAAQRERIAAGRESRCFTRRGSARL